MQEIIYRISSDEAIGLASGVCKAYIAVLNRDDEGLIYFPRKLKFKRSKNSKWETDSGCGAFSFGRFDGEAWIRSGLDYLNIDDTESLILKRTTILPKNETKQKLACKLKKAEKILREAGKL